MTRHLLLLVALVFLAAAPAARAGEITKTNVPLSMSDGAHLMSTEYLPSSGCPCPVVVNFNPYTTAVGEGVGGVSTLVSNARDYLVSRGYAVMIVDVRGTGQSEGTFSMFNSREQRDYAEVIQLASRQSFANGKVAVVGDSYGGIAALLAAEQPGIGPPHGPLRAIVPAVPMGDAYRDIAFSGGAPNDGFFTLWGAIVGGPTTVAPLLDAQSDPSIALNATSSRAGVWQQMVSGFVGINSGETKSGGDPESLGGATSYDGPWYRLRSPLVHIASLNVPTFVIGTSFDIFQRAEPLLFNALPLPQTEKKLYMDNQYHAVVGADSSSAPGYGTTKVYDDHGQLVPNATTVMTADWLDRWVKGKRNGAERWPNVLRRYLVPGSKAGGVFVRERQDPPADLRYAPWYLGSGSLGPTAPAAAGTAQTLFDPGTGACSRNSVQYLFGVVPDNECSTENRPNETDGVTFTSAPLVQPVALTGPSSLRLWFSATRPDTNLVAGLSAVAPDGSSEQFTFGSLIASFRAVQPRPCRPEEIVLDCSQTDASGEFIRPWHPFTRSSIQKLQPGQIYQALIEIFPPAIELPVGYRLRLTLKTGSFPQTLPNVSTSSDALGGITTFYFGGRHPSYLYLGGVSGGLRALRSAYDAGASIKHQRCPPPTGSLSNHRLGPVILGERRARVRRGLRRATGRRAPYTDVFCFTPIGIRVGYPPQAVKRRLNSRLQRAIGGRVVLILTANAHYELQGIRPGMPLAFAKLRLRLAPAIRTGANSWYLTKKPGINGVLKVRHGTVDEVGIADPRLTSPRSRAIGFLTRF